ncbi:hypothetical protein PoMZ_01983 [Pyricularia oryzae]|uniref:Uncharacterized protein n=1 Tax=Pyricularia oryzae TaxID=318829 RepID=A0A4P7N3X7_PYROR|nr:hypothetical protein PoMZ_01983 [Pyricularia oryzae]
MPSRLSSSAQLRRDEDLDLVDDSEGGVIWWDWLSAWAVESTERTESGVLGWKACRIAEEALSSMPPKLRRVLRTCRGVMGESSAEDGRLPGLEVGMSFTSTLLALPPFDRLPCLMKSLIGGSPVDSRDR